METVERTITVQRPRSSVWSYLGDFSSNNDWDPATVKTVLESGDGGVGSIYRNTSKVLGRETEIEYTVEESEPLHVLTVRGVSSKFTAVYSLTLTGDEKETTVRYLATSELNGALKLADPLLPMSLKTFADDTANKLHQSLLRL